MEQHLALLIILVRLSSTSEICRQDLIDFTNFLQQDLEPSLSVLLDDVFDDIKKGGEIQNVARTFLRPLMKTREAISKHLNRIRKHKSLLCNNEAISQQNKLITFRNKINSLFELFLKKTVSRVDKLQQMTKSLIQLKSDINNEVMGMITISDNNELSKDGVECKECNDIVNIIEVIKNINLCDHSERTNNNNTTTCLSPKDIEDELTTISDNLDGTVHYILTKVMLAQKVNETKLILKSLKDYNNIRSSIDEFLKFLTSYKGRRINQFSIKRLSNNALNQLKEMQKTCSPQCIPNTGDDCGIGVIKLALKKLISYKDLVKTEGLLANKQIREELIEFLDNLDNKKRKLQIEQIWSKTPDKCRQQSVKYLKIASDGIWPLVNLTLQNHIEVNRTDCWYETQHLCGDSQEQNRYNSYQQLTSRRGFMPRWKRQATPVRGYNRVPVNRSCPQIRFRQSSKECSGSSPNCWRPGMSDPDCLNNGLCCFDGCADKCLDEPHPDGPNGDHPPPDGPDSPDGPHPDFDCQPVSLRKCKNISRISREIEDKILYLKEIEENLINMDTQLDDNEIKSCDQTEYDETKKYIDIIDDVIKKSKEESDHQRLFQLGLVDIQTMFDNRVSLLFVEELCCYEEVDVIKGKFMPLLLICMDELMIGIDVTRLPSCVKNLRIEIFTRNNFLLDKVIKQGFNQTRCCPCHCKKSARQGMCPEECKIYSDDPQCCSLDNTTLEPEMTTVFGPEITETTTTRGKENVTTTLEPQMTTVLDVTTLLPETESDVKPVGFTTTLTTLSTVNVTDIISAVTVTKTSTSTTVTDYITTTPVTDDKIVPQVTDNVTTTTLTRPISGSDCPSQCQLPSGIPWTLCPSECSRWSSVGSGACCSPSCPPKCSPVRPDIQCSSDGVRECDNIPGCCPDKYETLFGNVYFP